MGKGKEGKVRVRLFFDDHRLLNNSQISIGHGRIWLLLKPSIATFADLASHLCNKFALCDHLVLFIGDFVLPPFESTRIIKDEDIIRVKQKNIKLKDVCEHCDTQDLVRDSQSDGNSQGNMKDKNAAHDNSFSPGILVPKQKREHSLELDNSIRKRQKYKCTEKQVTSIGVEDINSWQSRMSCDTSGGSKMEVHAKANEHVLELVVTESGAEVKLGQPVPASSTSCEGRQQPEGIKRSLESEPNTVCGLTKEYAQLSSPPSIVEQNQFTEKTCTVKDDYGWLDKKLRGSPNTTFMNDVQKIDFALLFPLIRFPVNGDVLAYRYVEPSSTAYPELSSPQVGKVSAFNNKSSVIVLVKVPEFEVFLEDSLISPTLLERPYKEDGSLEIKLSELVDVRLLKAHDSKELACLPEGTLNQIKKDNWKVASVKSNWIQSESHYTGGSNGPKPSTRERRASTSCNYGASPAISFFWETVLSKGAFGTAGKCSGSGKF